MAKPEKVEIKQPVAVLVEGADYIHVLLSQIDNADFDDIQLFDFSTLPPENATKDARGGQNAALRRYLRVLARANEGAATKLRALAVIRDAENNPAGQFASVSAVLAEAGWPMAQMPGQVARGQDGRKAGVLLLPADGLSGCLENALLAAPTNRVPSELLACARQFLDCVETHSRNDNWRAKVNIHAVLAGSTQNTQAPALTLGQSAKAGFWDFTQPSLKPLIDFLREIQMTA